MFIPGSCGCCGQVQNCNTTFGWSTSAAKKQSRSHVFTDADQLTWVRNSAYNYDRYPTGDTSGNPAHILHTQASVVSALGAETAAGSLFWEVKGVGGIETEYCDVATTLFGERNSTDSGVFVGDPLTHKGVRAGVEWSIGWYTQQCDEFGNPTADKVYSPRTDQFTPINDPTSPIARTFGIEMSVIGNRYNHAGVFGGSTAQSTNSTVEFWVAVGGQNPVRAYDPPFDTLVGVRGGNILGHQRNLPFVTPIAPKTFYAGVYTEGPCTFGAVTVRCSGMLQAVPPYNCGVNRPYPLTAVGTITGIRDCGDLPTEQQGLPGTDGCSSYTACCAKANIGTVTYYQYGLGFQTPVAPKGKDVPGTPQEWCLFNPYFPSHDHNYHYPQPFGNPSWSYNFGGFSLRENVVLQCLQWDVSTTPPTCINSSSSSQDGQNGQVYVATMTCVNNNPSQWVVSTAGVLPITRGGFFGTTIQYYFCHGGTSTFQPSIEWA